METKKCSKCGLTKPVNLFSKSTKDRSGYQSYCKECRKTYYKKRHTKKDQTGSTNLTFISTTDINATLSKIKPKDIISYLGSIGYYGKLKYTNEVNVGKP